MYNQKDRGNKGGFNKNNGNSGGRSGFGGDRRGPSKFGGGRDRGDKTAEMFSATCSSCQKKCEVPFRPSGEKPVYCSDCFSKRSETTGSNGRGESRTYDSRQQKDRFPMRKEHVNDRKQDSNGEIKKRLSDIEAKLNRILDLINPPMVSAGTNVDKKEKKVIVKRPVIKEELKEAVEKAVAKDKKPKVKAKKAVAKKVKKKK